MGLFTKKSAAKAAKVEKTETKKRKPRAKLKPVLITTDNERRGVFMGYIEQSVYDRLKKDQDKMDSAQISLKKVQMAVYWSADVRGVIGLAVDGPSDNCRITKAAPEFVVDGVTLIAPITEKAEKNWLRAPWNS